MVQLWDVARPVGGSRVPGVTMAGFRDRVDGIDIRAVPHPAVTLAIEFGDGGLVIDDVAGGQQRRGSLVAGLEMGPARVRGRGIECIQVRLSPVTAFSLLGTTSAELGGSVVSLEDLWGPVAFRIREQLAATPPWEARFRLVDTLLASRREARRSADPEVARSWDRIVASAGQIRVEDLATEVGWSRKRLWARFGTQIGLTPKRAAMLVRFDRAAHGLAAGRAPAQVAAECGYVDQSHLHRDVLAFAGDTPVTLAGEPWLAVDDVAWPTGDPWPAGRRPAPTTPDRAPR